MSVEKDKERRAHREKEKNTRTQRCTLRTLLHTLSMCTVLISVVWCKTIESCTVLPTNGLAIVKYYRSNCIHCQRIAPKIHKIIESIEKSGADVTGIMIDTEKCKDTMKETETKGIEAIPNIVVQKNGKEVLNFSGDKPYDEIVALVSGATGLSKSIFAPETDTTPKALIPLAKQDFLTGFQGPWAIYFEDEPNKAIEQILLQTYKMYSTDIKIAKYVGADKEIVAGRYYIYDYPGILIMYDGILMRYNGEMTLNAFSEFCARLIAPSFREVTADELADVSVPTFVVFYSDPILANRTFRRIAHDLKMNAQTYKMKVESENGENILRLAVYKNGTKYYYDGDIHDEGAVREWLFHAHFPNISKLSMDNFYSIFHGLKPVVALVSDGGNTKEIRAFEDIAYEHNRGSSSSSYVFAFIDRKEYPKFADTNFGILHGKPLIVFFDPDKQTFYGRRIERKESVLEYFDKTMSEYKEKTLQKYVKERPRSYKWVVCGCITIFGIGCVAKFAATARKKAQIE